MAWKKKEILELPELPPMTIAPKPQPRSQPASSTDVNWSIVEYPPNNGTVMIRNETTGEELTIYQALAELLSRTE